MKPMKASRKTSVRGGRLAIGAVVAMVCTIGTPSVAQPTSVPVAKKKAVRRSVLDLLGEVNKPRPGEIVAEAAPAAKPTTEAVPTEPVATQPISPAATDAPVAAKPKLREPEAAPAEKVAAPEVKKTATEKSRAAAVEGATPAVKPHGELSVPRVSPSSEQQQASSASGARFVAFDKAKLRVVAQHGNASLIQWRQADAGSGKPGAWEAVPADAEVTERREFRTGVGVSIEVRIDDQAVVTVEPLTRVLVERRIRSDGTSLPGVTIARGEISIAESASGEVFVKTGLDASVVRSGRVVFDGVDIKK